MATELHLSHNPAHGIKRGLNELKSSNNHHGELLHAVIESNVQTQAAVSEASKSISELVAILRAAGETPEEAGKSAPAPRAAAVPDGKLAAVEQKLDKLAAQNLQLIQVISELVRHLKGNSPQAPPSPPAYTGAYPLRPLR